MLKTKITQNITEEQLQKYEEIERKYRELCKELSKLEAEGVNIKKEIKTIIDKEKMRHVLEDILKQPD